MLAPGTDRNSYFRARSSPIAAVMGLTAALCRGRTIGCTGCAQDVVQPKVALVAGIFEGCGIGASLERHFEGPGCGPRGRVFEPHFPAQRVAIDRLEALGDLQVRACV